MSVQVLGIDYENMDGMASTLAATFKTARENGDILLNLADAAAARKDGRVGPKKNDPRPRYVHQPYPKAAHHPDGRTIAVESPAERDAAHERGFRDAPYPVVRAAVGDPRAEKAAREILDAETRGKIASQNDLILKLSEQVAALALAAKNAAKGR